MSATLRWRRADLIAALLVASVVGALELALLGYTVAGGWSALVALVAHGLVVAALVWWSRRLARAKRDARIAQLLVPAVAVLGPIGALGGMIANVTLYVSQARASLFAEWQRALSDRVSVQLPVLRYRDIVSRAPRAVQHHSLWAQMRHGNYADKLRLTAWLARRLQRGSVPLIHAALRDSDPAVRVQAATVVEKHEHDFTREWVRREAAARGAAAMPQVHLELAMWCDNYAYLELVDASRIVEIRARARWAYERCLELDPHNVRAAGALLRLLVRMGHYSEARRMYQRCVVDLAPESVTWYCEALFGLGDYRVLRKVAAAAVNSGALAGVSRKMRSVIGLWADPSRVDVAGETPGRGMVCVVPEPTPKMRK